MKRCMAILSIAAAMLSSHLVGAQYTFAPLPECEIRAVVGDFTQVDIVWADASEVTEYAFPSQWMAAQKIADIETEFSCSVSWERA